jgi:hypothetical protein
MIIDINVLADDTIRFFRKVSCEDDPYNDNYDYLAFYIDDQEMDRWDGEVPWGEVAYPVTAGEHTLKWEYYKDFYVSSGYDCAWVDYILFPGISDFVGIPDFPAQPIDMTLYPNPSRDHVQVAFLINRPEHVRVEVFDVSGRKVPGAGFQKMVPPGRHEHLMMLENLTEGAYYVVMVAGDMQVTQKLMIIR